jgi:hypothetical protein
MADEGRHPVAIRIARPYPSEEAFLEHELDTLTRTSVVLLGAQSRPQGVVLRFEVTLASGAPLLRGEGRVVGYKPNALNDEPGLTLRFTRLDPRSKALIDRAAALRDARARGVTRPDLPPYEPPLEVTRAGPPPSMAPPVSVAPPTAPPATMPPTTRAPTTAPPTTARPPSMRAPPSMPPQSTRPQSTRPQSTRPPSTRPPSMRPASTRGPSTRPRPAEAAPLFEEESPSKTMTYDRAMIEQLRSEHAARQASDTPPSNTAPRRVVEGVLAPPPDRAALLERLRMRGRDLPPVRVREILDASKRP